MYIHWTFLQQAYVQSHVVDTFCGKWKSVAGGRRGGGGGQEGRGAGKLEQLKNAAAHISAFAR